MTFLYPWVLIVPFAFGAVKLLCKHRNTRSVPYFSASVLSRITPSLRLRIRQPLLNLLEIGVVLTLSIAVARPQKILRLDEDQHARNIMLVIDTSNSMSGRDFPTTLGMTTRMEGVKAVVAEYVRSRQNDRVGLIVFGNSAYLQSPLTTDISLVEKLVTDLTPRIAGDGTAIGDGLGLALKRLREMDGDSKAIILMTDGVNTAGQVSPLKAAAVARSLNIKVHSIGIGSGAVALGSSGVLDLLARSRRMTVDIDEETLRKIASTTGGVYFNANSLDEFKQVYDQIQQLQEKEFEQPSKLIVQELFAPWAWISLGLLFILILLEFIILREVP